MSVWFNGRPECEETSIAFVIHKNVCLCEMSASCSVRTWCVKTYASDITMDDWVFKVVYVLYRAGDL